VPTPSGEPTNDSEPTPSASPSSSPSNSSEEAVDDELTDVLDTRCPLPATEVAAEAGINEVLISWSFQGLDSLTWNGAATAARPTQVFIRVTDLEAASSSFAVVEATADGFAPERARVTGLRNGVTYSFSVITATEDGSAEASGSVTATPSTGTEGTVAGVIVQFADGQTPSVGSTDVPGEDRVDTVALEVASTVSDDAVLVEFSEAVDPQTAQQVADDLAGDAAVDWAEPDLFVAPASTSSGAPSDTAYDFQWNLWGDYGIGLGDGADVTTDAYDPDAGDGVTVAVVDTGITDHPDLAGQLVDGYDFVSSPESLGSERAAGAGTVAFDGDYVDTARYGAVGRDANPADPGDWRSTSPARSSTWHGTKVAGVIAAAADNADGIAGIAPGAKIQPVRALSWRGGLLSDIAASITWASGGTVDGVPANATPAKVVNLSFSVEAACPRSLQDAIDGARGRGSVIVAAAGNAASDAGAFAPGNCTGVITTGASDESGKRAGYSNYGTVVDISAPGAAVTTLSNDGSEAPNGATTGSTEGTSIAAAHVAAAAARYVSAYPSATPDDTTTWLTGTAVRSFAGDKCDDSIDATCGTGILSLAQVSSGVTITFDSNSLNTRCYRSASPYPSLRDFPSDFTDADGTFTLPTDVPRLYYYGSSSDERWIFQGWSTSAYRSAAQIAAGTNVYQPGDTVTLPAGDHTLYALWTTGLYTNFATRAYTPNGQPLLHSAIRPTPVDAPADYVPTQITNLPTNLAGQTYREVITMSSTVPLLQGYVFDQWKLAFLYSPCNIGYKDIPAVYAAVDADDALEDDGVNSAGYRYYTPGDRFQNWGDYATIPMHTTWTPRTDYALSFDENVPAGASTSASATSDITGLTVETYTSLPAAPTLSGYTFTGWNTRADGYGTNYAAGARFWISAWHETRTLYAQWTPNNYTVYINDNKGASAATVASYTGTFDETITLNTSAPTSWYPAQFDGFNTAADGSGDSYSAGGTVPIATTSDITLYMQWKYKVEFRDYYLASDTSEFSGNLLATYLISANSPSMPSVSSSSEPGYKTVAGYTFTGWNTANDGSGTSYTDGSGTITWPSGHDGSDTLYLYAQFSASTYTVQFDENGGDPVTDLTFTTGGSITVPDGPTRTGYTFRGWNTQSDGSGTYYSPGDTFTPGTAANVTLYAVWKASQTITFTDPGDQAREISGDDTAPLTVSSDSGLAVTVTSSTASVCSVALVASTWTVTKLVSGTCTLVASQAGNGAFSAAASVSRSFTVNGVTQVVSFGDVGTGSRTDAGSLITASPSSPPAVSFTANDTFPILARSRNSGDTAYTRLPLTFTSSTPSVCSVSGAGQPDGTVETDFHGVASPGTNHYLARAEVTMVGAGTCTIVVTQDGYTAGTPNGYVPDSASQTIYFQQIQTVNFTNITDTSTNTPVIPYIPASGGRSATSFDVAITSSSDNPFVGRYAYRVSDAWGPLGSDGNAASMSNPPASSTVCGADGTSDTVTILTTGKCYVAGKVAGTSVWLDTDLAGVSADSDSDNIGGTYYLAGATYQIVDGFWIDLDANYDGGTDTYVAAAQNADVTLPTPTRSGWTFAGWNTSASGTGTSYPAGVVRWTGTEATTLYAQWTRSVTFDSQGGSAISGTTYVDGGTIADPGTPVRSGYTFNGWFENSSLGTAVTFPYTPSGSGDITLYAQWTGDSHTVTFDSNGGSSVADGSYTTGGSLSEPAPPVRSGYTFGGWALTDGGSALTWTTGVYLPSGASDFTLYALWTVNRYTVTFDANGGSGAPADVSATYGSAVTIPGGPTTAKAGHVFAGWSSTSSGAAQYTEGTRTWATDFGDNGATGTLYAAWTPESYTVSFDANGGSGTASNVTSTFGLTVSLPGASSFTRTGHRFLGWATSASATTTDYASGSVLWTTDAGADGATDTLYAVWDEESYTVIFDANGGSGTATSVTPTFGSSVTLPSSGFSRAGYTFGGWATSSSATTADYASGLQTWATDAGNQGATAYLFAVWTPISYTVTYDSQGGTSVTDGSFEADGSVAAPTPPARTGYDFVGWSSDSATQEAVTFPYEPGVYSNITLYAIWGVDQSLSMTDPGAQELEDTYASLAVANTSGLDATLTVNPSATSTCSLVESTSPEVTASETTVTSGATVSVKMLAVGSCEITASAPATVLGASVYSAAEDVSSTFSIRTRSISDGRGESTGGGTALTDETSPGTTLAVASRNVGNDGVPVTPPALVPPSGQALYIEADGTFTQTPQVVVDTTTSQPYLTAGGQGDLQLTLRGNETGATTYDEPNSKLVFHLEKKGQAEGTGFMPNTQAEVWMFSTPRYLGTTNVRADGSWVIDFLVPPNLEIGEHSIQAEGIAPDGRERTVKAFVMVDREEAPAPVKKPRIIQKSLVLTFPQMSAKLSPRQQSTVLRFVKAKGLRRIVSVGYVQPSGSTVNDILLSYQRAIAGMSMVDRRKVTVQTDIVLSSRAKGRRTAPEEECAKVSNRCAIVTFTYKR